GYLSGLEKALEMERWPKKVLARPVALRESLTDSGLAKAEEPPHPLTPLGAARLARKAIGLDGGPVTEPQVFEGDIEDVNYPTASTAGVVAVVRTDSTGHVHSTGQTTVHAAQLLATYEGVDVSLLLLASSSEESQRRAVAEVWQWFH